MKRCEYCAKEISYYEMYCSEECQNSAGDFYDLRDKFQKLFAVVNGVFVMTIGISIFLYSFMHDVGVIGGGSAMIILGLLYMFLPFPPDVMIKKYQLKKSIFFTRIIAAVILFLGGIVFLLFFLKLI